MELAGRHVVVTGAASGIGRACAEAFAAHGARLVLADIDEERVDALAQELGAVGMRADVGRERDIRALIDAAQSRHGPIDLFHSNAGIGGPPGGPEAPDDALARTWEVNVMSHVWAARALLPEMTERGEGHLLITASAAGLLAQMSGVAYTITKHAAVAFAEWLAIAYADEGIRVWCLCPQGVDTPMLRDAAAADPVGTAPLLAETVIEPAQVAQEVVRALAEEPGRFFILPHPEVAEYAAFKAARPERWQAAMRGMLSDARAARPES